MTSSGTASRVAAVASASLLATLAGLTARCSWHQRRIERSWLTDIAPRLDSIGEVDQLTIFRPSSACRPARISRASQACRTSSRPAPQDYCLTPGSTLGVYLD